jgi:WD40 repeat protein
MGLLNGIKLAEYVVGGANQLIFRPYVSPETRYIVFGYRENQSVYGLSIYDITAEETHNIRHDASGSYRGLGWSPDGAYFASTSVVTDEVIIIWDVQNLEPIISIDSIDAPFNYLNLEWQADGQAILLPNGIRTNPCETHGCNTIVQVMAVPSGDITHILRGHHKTVNYALWAPGEDRVVTASEDGTIRMWDLAQEADYLGCDPDQELSAGEIIRFTDSQTDISGFDAPGSATVVDTFPTYQDYIIYDGPVCVDRTDW